MNTPIKKEIIDGLVAELGITDFAKATIREVKQVAAKAEKASGVEFIKMEMGIPGLPAAQVGVDAQIKALQDGIAHSYPDIQGAPALKEAASQFVKAFIGVDVKPEGCVPVTGSMQGTFASFLTCSQRDASKDTVLFIDPGFPVQKMQLDVMGVKYQTFDVYDYRGEKLGPKLEGYLKQRNICAIVYSNPNNPAWICLEEEELQVIGELATKYDAVVMEDLAYFCMDYRRDLGRPFEPPFLPTVARYTDNYILMLSASKIFSYAGQRIALCCIGDKLYDKQYPALAARYQDAGVFGVTLTASILYMITSGCTATTQYAYAEMLRLSCEGEINFVEDTREYARRAARMKEIFCRHGFSVVYDHDVTRPVGDGFFFTLGYDGLSGDELVVELMYYGVSSISLSTTGSHRQGVRGCTSRMREELYPVLEERMAAFEQDHPKK